MNATSYLGQNTSTAAVLVQSGNTVAMGTANVFLNQTGVITVSGQLNLNGINPNPGSTFSFNTTAIIVTASPAGRIKFDNKVKQMLSENAFIQNSIIQSKQIEVFFVSYPLFSYIWFYFFLLLSTEEPPKQETLKQE